MKTMIIYMHPNFNSFNGAILQSLKEALPEAVVYAPAAEGFFPNLTKEEYEATLEGKYEADVLQAQQDLMEADHVIFHFPLWWGSFPAVGKGFIDRVFAYGKAYELEGETPIPLLNGTKASLVFTTGAPPEEFHESGMYENVVWGIEQHLLSFCGLELDGVLHFGDVIQISDEHRKEMLTETRNFAIKLK